MCGKVIFPGLSLTILLLIKLLIVGLQPLAAQHDTVVPAHRFQKEMNNKSFDELFALSYSVLYSDPDSARQIIKYVLDHHLYKGKNEQIKGLNLAGASHHLQANYITALDYYYQALELAMDIDDQLQEANIYNNIGNVHLKIGNYKDALELYLKACDIYSKLSRPKDKASANNNIGLLYLQISNYEKAQSQFRMALSGFRAQNDSIGVAATMSNLGLLLRDMGKYDSAVYFHQQSITSDIKNGNNYGLCIGLQEFAETYFASGQPRKAIHYFRWSKQVAKKIDQPFTLAISNLGMAEMYIEVDSISTALKFVDTAMAIGNELNNINLKQRAHKLYASIYEQQGKFAPALENYRQSVILEDSLINQTKLHQLYNIEIEELSNAKKIQQLEIQRQKLLINQKNYIILFILVVFLLMIGGLYLVYVNYIHRRKVSLQKTILSLNEKKSRVAAEAELKERMRIGQELHDGIGQLLSVAKLNINVMLNKKVMPVQRRQTLLESTLRNVDNAFTELREISHNLAPSVLSSKGLASALNELADQVNQSNQLDFQLQMYGLGEPLGDILENALYRATQELLSNVIKHSGASGFFVQIIKGSDEITLMAEDNGKGFHIDQNIYISGRGLSNIKSRVENLNGSIFVDSLANRGTIVTIIIPIKQAEHEQAENQSNGHRRSSGYHRWLTSNTGR